jgi:hypothetical protein
MTYLDETEEILDVYVRTHHYSIPRLYEMNDERLPIKCRREYWREGNYFVLKEVKLCHKLSLDGRLKTIFGESSYVGDYFEQGVLKNPNIKLYTYSAIDPSWEVINEDSREFL